jgi:hypothetical protein
MEPGATKMASRTRKSSALPVKQNTIAVITYIPELPGALFFGEVIDEDIRHAMRLQRISARYASHGCPEMLWHDLSQMGFDSTEIRDFVVNPTAITSCGYGRPNPAVLSFHLDPTALRAASTLG